MIKYLKNEKFEDEINKDLILVDFYTDWCGPCKMLGKVMETIDSVDILKINVDEQPELAKKFGVMSIPTIILFHNKEALKKSIGFIPKDELEELITNTKKEIH